MRGKWWVALLALIAFPAAMAALTQVMDKRYTASMRLLATQRAKGVDFASGPFAPIDDMSNSSVLGSIDTTVAVLTGTEVLGDAIVRTANKYPKAFQSDQISDKYESLVRRLAVDSSQLSDVVTIRVTMDNPEIAAEIANNIGFAFIDYVRRMESESGNAALALIKANLGDTQKRLSAIEDEIKTTKEQYNITDQQASNQGANSMTVLMETELSKLEGQLNSARSALSVAESIAASTPKTIKTSSTAQTNPTLVDLMGQKERIENTIEGLKIKYMDDADPIKEQQRMLISVNKSINEVQKQIDASATTGFNPNYQQASLAIDNLKTSIASFEQQVASARSLLDSQKAKFATLPGAERKLNELMRQRMILENSFAQLEQRKDVIESTGSGRKSPAKIVSTALAPSAPSFPDVRLFTLIGLALGFVVAALIIMPKGDTDLYGQWPRSGAKPLKGKSSAAVPTATEAPVLGTETDPDTTQA